MDFARQLKLLFDQGGNRCSWPRGALARAVRLWAAAALVWVPGVALAVSVSVAGIFPGKALLVIDGGAPKTVLVGQKTAEGVTLVAIDGDVAQVDVDGQRRSLRVGQHVVSQKSSNGPATVILTADSRGHFVTSGTINGQQVRFLVDTGATAISMGYSDAVRMGIDPRKGQVGYSQTANGVITVYRVKLDTVQVGEIVMHNVDGSVAERDMPVLLLGMSFLNRTEMVRDGGQLVLKKRY